MEYFRSGLKSVLGAPASGTQPTGAETVERLVSRVSTSTLLEDRRDACRALKALSKKYRLEVGAQGMDVLRQILELDRSDCEIIGYCLDTLCNITSPETFDEETSTSMPTNVNIGEQFTEMFIKNADNVTLVLSFLEEYDYRVRWPAVKLLTTLLASKPKEIQDVVLISPMGVSKLMDLLMESREIIRNDTLLLLINLTRSNANIQKIVAFENAFDRLFDVIREEGSTDGGIVVEDCLLLMLNLLRNNASNISFFNEGSYVQRLAPMVAPPAVADGEHWAPQKVANVHCVLQIVRALVSPNNPAQLVSACQKAMRNAKLLEALCDMLMANGVPADILTETINTVGEVLRGNLANQEHFANVTAPSTPPRPVVVVLLMSMVNEKQPFALRCAVLYCFQCFLFKNEIGQEQVVQTLLPSSSNNTSVTTGQLLCSGLFGNDIVGNWFSAACLAHTLLDNPAQKEQLLRVLLATDVGAQPVSLLHQCAQYLQQSGRHQSKIGILMLLAVWTSHCSAAVQALVKVTGAMAYLTAQTSATEYDDDAEEIVQGLCAFLIGLCLTYNDGTVANYSRENLCQLVEKRVGLDVYCKKLAEVSRHESYARAAKQPQITAKNPNELLLEFEFCKLFKMLEPIIIKALGVQRELSNGMSELSLGEHENALLLQYKELIREQDRKLQELQKTINLSQREKEDLKAQIEELRQSNSQLHDHSTLLKAQLQLQNNNKHTTDGTTIDAPLAQVVAPPADDRVEQLEAQLKAKTEELERTRKDQDDLLELLAYQDNKLNTLKNRLKELGETIVDTESDDENSGNSEQES